MASDWRPGKLGDFVKLLSGGTPSKSRTDFWNGSVPWVSAKDMKTFWVEDSEDHLTEAGARKARIVPARTTLILVRGMTLHNDIPICRLRRPSAFNQDVKAVIPKEGLDPEYLPYLLVANKASLLNSVDSAGHGTGRLNTETLTDLPVLIPSLEEQKSLADFATAMEDKIELNRRMNATLEAIARALFKAWFVDFEPVHANLENRPSTSASPEIAKLFPSTFENGIPKGWRAGTVGENFNLTMGRSPSGDTYNKDGEGEVFYQGRTDFGFRFPTPRVYCTQPSTFAEKDDTLLSVRAPVGDVNIAPDKCCIGRGIAAVRHKSGSRSFTYYNLWNLASHFDNFESEGTVFGSITKIGLQNTKIVEPLREIIMKFEEVVGKLDDRIESNSKEILTLSEIRDSSLPRLISGRIGTGS